MSPENDKLLNTVFTDSDDTMTYIIDPDTGCHEIKWSRIKANGKLRELPIHVNADFMIMIKPGVHDEYKPLMRVLYENEYGEIPEGKIVTHSCSFRSIHAVCANPEHLILADPGFNRRKLTDEQVLAIREDNRKHIDIAKEYGIARTTVTLVKNKARRASVVKKVEESKERSMVCYSPKKSS